MEHYANRCIVEYRATHSDLYKRELCLKALSLNEHVLEQIIDGTLDENFDSNDVELIEACNDIEAFCGDKDWGHSYLEVRNLISSGKSMDAMDNFEHSLRPRMFDQDAVEISLGMKPHPKLDILRTRGCEIILVANCIDLYDMYYEYAASHDDHDIMDSKRFNLLLKESFKCGFISENALFWNVLHLHRLVIAYFNRMAIEHPNSVETVVDRANHIHTKPLSYWSPNHELSCYIVRVRYNEDTRSWEYVL